MEGERGVRCREVGEGQVPQSLASSRHSWWVLSPGLSRVWAEWVCSGPAWGVAKGGLLAGW